MTWVVGTPPMWGYGFGLSDNCVTNGPELHNFARRQEAVTSFFQNYRPPVFNSLPRKRGLPFPRMHYLEIERRFNDWPV